MCKNRSKKSVRLQNHRSHKLPVKRRRSATGNRIVHAVKAESSRVKAANPVNQSASKRVNVSAQAKAQTGKASIAAPSIAVNPQLQE